MKNSEKVQEQDNKKESPCRSCFMRKYIIVSVPLFLMIAAALAFIFFTQEQKSDPASEKVIRIAAARQLHKDPNELTDEDFSKITEMSIIPTMGSGGNNYWIDVSTGKYVSTLRMGELADIHLLGKFTNLQTLYLGRIKFPQQYIPKWMKILAKSGIFNLSEKFSIDLSPLENCSNLETLLLNESEIKNIEPLSRLVNLKRLSLSGTGVSNVEPIRGLTNLQRLDLSRTRTEDFEPLKYLKNLQALHLESAQISDLEPVKELVNLKRLYLYNTRVSNLEPISGLIQLDTLDLNCTDVSDLEPIRNLMRMNMLNISNTKVTNLEPIKDLVSLNNLMFVSTGVSDLEPIRGLSNLLILQIGDTPVSDLEPIKELKLLKYIYMENCSNITQEQVDDLKKALSVLQFGREAVD